MDPKSITLAGGRTLTVTYDDGRTESLHVHQLKLRQYRAAAVLIDDEIGLCALCCIKTVPQIEQLTPASYEAVHAAVQEVNADGFFSFARRRIARNAENLKNLPPEYLEKMFTAYTSLTPSPGIPPPAA